MSITCVRMGRLRSTWMRHPRFHRISTFCKVINHDLSLCSLSFPRNLHACLATPLGCFRLATCGLHRATVMSMAPAGHSAVVRAKLQDPLGVLSRAKNSHNALTAHHNDKLLTCFAEVPGSFGRASRDGKYGPLKERVRNCLYQSGAIWALQ